MKKIFRFIIHNRKNIIKAIVIGTVAIVAYEIAHHFATIERGYEAIGGEIFVPFLIIFAEDIWGMFKEPIEIVEQEKR